MTVLSLSPEQVVRAACPNFRELVRPHDVQFVSSDAHLTDHVSDVEFILGDWTHETALPSDAVLAAKNCSLIVQPSAGYDEIDINRARSVALPVVNTPGANSQSVSEWVIMAMLALSKNMILNHNRMIDGEWAMVRATDEGIHELANQTIGILGLGQIGQQVAEQLVAFGVSLLYYDPNVNAEALSQDLAVSKVASLERLCSLSDILTIHVPLNEYTRNSITPKELDKLGRNGILINASRGGVVSEAALLNYLRTDSIKGAALDVFQHESSDMLNAWRRLDNVLLSPHVSGGSIEARQRMFQEAFDALRSAMNGNLPKHVVNGVASLR